MLKFEQYQSEEFNKNLDNIIVKFVNSLKSVVNKEFEKFVIDMKAKIVTKEEDESITVFNDLDAFKDRFEVELRRKVLQEFNRQLGKRSVFNFSVSVKNKIKNVQKPKNNKGKI